MLFLKTEKHFLQPLFTHWKLLDPVLIKIYFSTIFHLIIIFFKKKRFFTPAAKMMAVCRRIQFSWFWYLPFDPHRGIFLWIFGSFWQRRHRSSSTGVRSERSRMKCFCPFFCWLVNSGLRWYLSASFDKLSKRCCSFWVAVSTAAYLPNLIG